MPRSTVGLPMRTEASGFVPGSTSGKFARFFYEIGRKTVSVPQSTLKVGIHSTLVAHAAVCVGPCMIDDRRKN